MGSAVAQSAELGEYRRGGLGHRTILHSVPDIVLVRQFDFGLAIGSVRIDFVFGRINCSHQISTAVEVRTERHTSGEMFGIASMTRLERFARFRGLANRATVDDARCNLSERRKILRKQLFQRNITINGISLS